MAEPVNTPVPASTPRSASPLHHGITSPISPTKLSTLSSAPRPRVLHVAVVGQAELPPDFAALASRCDIVTTSGSRSQLLQGLRDRKSSDADVALSTAAELVWDAELVEALPPTVKLLASQGDFDEKSLKERGIQSVSLKKSSGEGSAASSIQAIVSLLDKAAGREKP